jgi:predicted RNA-binding protein Jag
MEEEKRDRSHRTDPRNRGDLPSKNMPKIISEIEAKLKDAILPESLGGLNSFERKLVHRHFDHSQEFQTRTYRDGERFTLKVYPVANIATMAREKAKLSMDTGQEVALPPMGSYERFIVHKALKEFAGIETTSRGEGDQRHVNIVSKRFGRGLKRIAKKIKLF